MQTHECLTAHISTNMHALMHDWPCIYIYIHTCMSAYQHMKFKTQYFKNFLFLDLDILLIQNGVSMFLSACLLASYLLDMHM